MPLASRRCALITAALPLLLAADCGAVWSEESGDDTPSSLDGVVRWRVKSVV